MFEKIKGQDRALSVLSKLLSKNKASRTLLFLGPRGSGKMTTALEVARFLLEKNPLLSPDVSVYRNDNYGLKTRYFLDLLKKEGEEATGVLNYFHILLNRLSQAVYLGEFSNDILSKHKVQDFRSEFEENLLNQSFVSWVEEKKVKNRLEALSDILETKHLVPIRQIRHLIDFHHYHSDAPYRISILGEFDQATEEAQNSSLKLLEEPGENTLIILTAVSAERLLPTILSRSLIIKFQTLMPREVSDIMGVKGKATSEVMQNVVYGYAEKRKQNLERFFTEIAPKVQYEFTLFEFIDELTMERTRLIFFFLEDLIGVFRDILIRRNGGLRKVNLNDFLPFPELDFTLQLARKTVTSEIRQWVKRLEEEYKGIRQFNLNQKTFLPALLTDLSRWYQLKMK